MTNSKGGFECEFVEKPQEAFQSECPVCLLVLREPFQVTCCGYAFCQACIQKIKQDNKPCPCCNKNFDQFEDKRLKRSLYEFKVHCTNKQLGCQWVGELGELDNHLNSNPTLQKQLDGCRFMTIKCQYCSALYQRLVIHVHQMNECVKRPFGCDYCKNFKSTYEDVTTNHWPVCGYYSEPCPNNCGETLQRQGLESHIANDCPQTLIDCDFKHAGCKEKLPRKLMMAHLNKLENIAMHLSQEVAYRRTEMARLENENRRLIQQVAKLTQDLQEMQVKSTLYPVEFTIQNFRRHQTGNHAWYSPPFYTHHKGYKMNLRVFHSICYGKGIYLTVQIGRVQGEYDEQLTWPFRGEFTVQLLSQEGDGDHHDTLTVIASTAGKNYTFEERMKDGWKASKFIPNITFQSKYLKDDSIKIRISKILVWY